MNQLNHTINDYLNYCENRKRLNSHTLKAYHFDLKQFANFISDLSPADVETETLEKYIEHLIKSYKTKTVKRKLASVRAFFHYMYYKNIIEINPFHKLQLHFREESVLPKTIPMHTIETLFSAMYQKKAAAATAFQKMTATRDIAILETLFATGIRISELCSLTLQTVNLIEQNIRIHGKGNKERIIQIENDDVLAILKEYLSYRNSLNPDTSYFFINRYQKGLSEQSVRKMIHQTSKDAAIEQNITPHMFRHSFATYLLDENVDIRYIQELLGHSSISVTQIYTHVSTAKQKEILEKKHPRNRMRVFGNDNC